VTGRRSNQGDGQRGSELMMNAGPFGRTCLSRRVPEPMDRPLQQPELAVMIARPLAAPWTETKRRSNDAILRGAGGFASHLPTHWILAATKCLPLYAAGHPEENPGDGVGRGRSACRSTGQGCCGPAFAPSLHGVRRRELKVMLRWSLEPVGKCCRRRAMHRSRGSPFSAATATRIPR